MNFHRSETPPREDKIAVVDDQVPASGWMSVDLGRMFAGSVIPTVSLGQMAPSSGIPAASVVKAPSAAPDLPVAPPSAFDAPPEPFSAAADRPSEEIEAVGAVAPTPRRIWPKRSGTRSRREPAQPFFPHEPIRRVPDRDLIVVLATPRAPPVEEPVLDLAEEATPIHRPAPRKRWWIVALLATVMAGGLVYSFTGLGETRVISVPDTGRKDSVVT